MKLNKTAEKVLTALNKSYARDAEYPLLRSSKRDMRALEILLTLKLVTATRDSGVSVFVKRLRTGTMQ